VRKYSVFIAPIVQDQIRAQVLYIARDSIDHALDWESRLRKAIMEIGALPTSNSVDEAASARISQEVRKMVFERTYLVFYRIRKSNHSVDILNFRHGARLPQTDEP
jgi:plasmid stabilization system protein ParE